MTAYQRTLAGTLVVFGLFLTSCAGNRHADPGELSPREAARASFAIAESMRRNGFEAEAIQHYERTLAFNPDYRGVNRWLGVLYDRTGQTGKAEKAYRLALAESPRDADLRNDFGYFCYTRMRYAEAEQHFREAVRLRGSERRFNINLGLAIARQGRYVEALTVFERVLSEAEARSNLGVVMVQRGDWDEGEKMLETAVELDPFLDQPKIVLRWMDEYRAAGGDGELPEGFAPSPEMAPGTP